MHDELLALLVVILLFALAAYSGMGARATPRDNKDEDRPDIGDR